MATFADLEKSLSGLVPEALLKKLQKAFDDAIEKALNENISTERGKVTGISQSAGKIVKEAIKDFTSSRVYKESMTSLLRNMDSVADTKLSIYKDSNFRVNQSTVTSAQKLATGQFLDAMNEDGLNARFNQSLRTLIYDSIQQGLSQQDLTKTLYDAVRKNGDPILSSHITQISQAAADSYSKAIDQEILDRYKDRITHYRVVGTLIDTSSPQCVRAVKDYDREIPVDEVADLIAFAKKHGGNENLTAKTLPTLGLHPNCRHSFIPIIKK